MSVTLNTIYVLYVWEVHNKISLSLISLWQLRRLLAWRPHTVSNKGSIMYMMPCDWLLLHHRVTGSILTYHILKVKTSKDKYLSQITNLTISNPKLAAHAMPIKLPTQSASTLYVLFIIVIILYLYLNISGVVVDNSVVVMRRHFIRHIIFDEFQGLHDSWLILSIKHWLWLCQWQRTDCPAKTNYFYNICTTSSTLVQHCINGTKMFCVYRVGGKIWSIQITPPCCTEHDDYYDGTAYGFLTP